MDLQIAGDRRRFHPGGRQIGRIAAELANRLREGADFEGERQPSASDQNRGLDRHEHPEHTVVLAGIADRVELLGRYAQRDAPALYRRADLLLHTKVLDPCPTAVIEAMACGLPVVYAASGGTVELVGGEAGVGVPHPVSWERDEPPAPEELAEAVSAVLAQRDRFAKAARRRAVERFSLEPWLDRHTELFSQLVAPRARTSRAR